jgi:uncharacterized membrane protein
MRFAPLVLFHILAGLTAIVSGFVTVAFRKGSRGHRAFGNLFFISMLGMAGAGSLMAFIKYEFAHVGAQIVNVFVGSLTIYLVATAWWAAKRREGETSVFDWGGLLLVATLAACLATFGVEAAKSPTGLKDGYPPFLYFIFASIAFLSASGDLRMLLHGGISGAQRIARHLWRMTLAMFIATASFFLGQQKVMPVSIRGSKLLLVPPLLVLFLLFYWLIRVLFTSLYKKATPPFASRQGSAGFRRQPLPKRVHA